MSWLGRKFDSLAGAVVAACGSMALSQAQAFLHQYLQRLGGQFDEAARQAAEIVADARYQALDAASRRALAEAAAARVAEIRHAYDAIREADPLLQPLVLLRHIDWTVARRVLPDFQPALPLDAASLIWAGAGLLLGLLAWELVKLPLALAGRAARG